jgi:hypothetical protein
VKNKKLIKRSSIFASAASFALIMAPTLSNANSFAIHTSHSTSSQQIAIQDACKQDSDSNNAVCWDGLNGKRVNITTTTQCRVSNAAPAIVQRICDNKKHTSSSSQALNITMGNYDSYEKSLTYLQEIHINQKVDNCEMSIDSISQYGVLQQQSAIFSCDDSTGKFTRTR